MSKHRWTIEELKNVNDAQFAMAMPVLEKVMDTLKYTPFAQRLTSVFNTLTDMAVDGGLTDEERSKNNGC